MRNTLVGLIAIGLVVIGSAIVQIEEITTNEYGTQITFESGKGYWIERGNK